MPTLDELAEQIHASFEARTAARDRALAQARTLTRHCAHAIRATHRNEWALAQQHLDDAQALAAALHKELADYPDLYYAGYTQDALKEYAEAVLVRVLVNDHPMPGYQELGLEAATYLQGLAEAVGELRRRCLDALLHNKAEEARLLLEKMDDIYAILVTMDYPDAITGGIRRLTDVARGILERTRGDLTMSLRQESLEKQLGRLEQKLQDLPPG
ncbi:MAG: haloacid dehalogenase [Anaerolineales bacterium]|nr:haloacid dehalogenase [Anaerolineales bacterium]